MRKGVSGVTVIRNAAKLGYPFYYSVKSVIDACDEFVISEGFSEDSTMDIVRQLQKEYPGKIRVIHDVWKPSRDGETIATVTNNAMSRCRYDWIYYVQADEIVHEDNLSFIADVPHRFNRYRAVSFRFTHFFLNLLSEMLAYPTAIRMVRNFSRPWRMNVRRLWYRTPPGRLLRGYYSVDPVVKFIDAYSVGDGGTFSGRILPVLQAKSQNPIFHVSYVNKEKSVVLNKIDSHVSTLFSQSIWTMPLRLASEAIRAGEGVESWRFFGSKIIPYGRRDYPRMLLDWARTEGLEYVH